jgi:hypothetical protein
MLVMLLPQIVKARWTKEVFYIDIQSWNAFLVVAQPNLSNAPRKIYHFARVFANIRAAAELLQCFKSIRPILLPDFR